MKTITLRLSEEENKKLSRLASDSNMSTSEYIKKKVLPNNTSNSKIEISEIIKLAKKLPIGTEFTIPGLFPIGQWNNYDTTSRRIVSRTFMKLIKDEDNSLSYEFEFIGKKSNLSSYKRL